MSQLFTFFVLLSLLAFTVGTKRCFGVLACEFNCKPVRSSPFIVNRITFIFLATFVMNSCYFRICLIRGILEMHDLVSNSRLRGLLIYTVGHMSHETRRISSLPCNLIISYFVTAVSISFFVSWLRISRLSETQCYFKRIFCSD